MKQTEHESTYLYVYVLYPEMHNPSNDLWTVLPYPCIRSTELGIWLSGYPPTQLTGDSGNHFTPSHKQRR